MYICQNSFRICKTCWFASLLTLSLPVCIHCSTAIASLLFHSAMLPTTCQTVSPSRCHTCAWEQTAVGRRAPLAGTPWARSPRPLLPHLTLGCSRVCKHRARPPAFLSNTQVFSANRQNTLPFNYTQANVVWYLSIFPV